MADNDVKIKISLDGGQEVEVGLRGVGDQAETADNKTSKLASNGLKGVAIAGAAVAAIAVGAGAGLWNIAKGAADAGDRIDEMSNKLGISYEAYQSWDYVLSQTGANIESLKGSMQRLAVSVDDARAGTGPAADAFARLGISVDELAGLSREDIFALTVERLQGVTDSAERAAIAQDLLGRGATELGGLLNSTAEDTEALKQQAIDLGLILSDEAVAAGDAFNDSLDTLQRTMGGVKNTIGAQLLPGLTEVTLGLSGLLAGTEGSEERIQAGAETLVGSIETVAPKILNVFSSLLGAVAVIAPSILGSLVEGISANLPSFITTLTGAVVSLVGILAAQAPALISSGAEAIVAIATGIASALPTLVPVLVTGVIGVIGSLITALPALLQAGITLVQGLASGILAAIPQLIAQLPMLIDGIVAFIETGVPMLLEAGIQLFMGIVEALPEIINQLVTVLPDMITAIIGAIVGAVPLLVQAGVTLLTALVGALPTIITSIVTALPQIITAILNAVLGALPVLVQAGITLFIALIQALPQIIITIVQAIPQIIGGIVKALVGAIPELIMAGVQLLTALITNMPMIVGTIVAAIPQIIGGIVGALGDGIWQVIQVGGDIVRGIWEGISGAAGWLFNQIAGFVDDVVNNIASFFGIASPSKVMRDQIGAFLPSGIGLGVAQHEQDAIRPIQDLNSSIMDEARRLNTTIAFTHSDTLEQTLVPLRPTPQQAGPINVEATLDSDALAGAIADAFADSGDQERAMVGLDGESIRQLGDYIVEALRADARQGTSPLG